MRNPARIYPLLNEIGDLWIKEPDLRFGQLITNISGGKDLFYIEDENFEKLIDKYKKKNS